MISAQRETQPAQMRHPLRLEALSEPMTARPDHSEHDNPPWRVRHLTWRSEFDRAPDRALSSRVVSTTPFTRTHQPSPGRREESYFTLSQQPYPATPLIHRGPRRMGCAPVASQTPRAASIHLARDPHHG
jgi:hypothetical protein